MGAYMKRYLGRSQERSGGREGLRYGKEQFQPGGVQKRKVRRLKSIFQVFVFSPFVKDSKEILQQQTSNSVCKGCKFSA